MTHVLGAFAVLLAIVTVGYAAWWTIVLVHILRARRSVPRLRDAGDLPAGIGRVSVVIPAHNEGSRIVPAVQGILAQVGVDVELILALDRCTDDTREQALRAAAGDARVRVVEIAHCPVDWAGKCHAAAAGAAVATGDHLLFTDADVRFEPTAVRRALALARTHDADLASLLPTLEVRHSFEYRWQPVASFMLMRIFPAERVNRDVRPSPFANGQFLLFSRSAYEAIGGHAAVKFDVLEDLAFARAMRKAKRRTRLFSAGPEVRTAMYDSREAFRSGWRRIYIEGAARRPRYLRRLALECAGSGVLGPAAAACALVAVPLAWPSLDAGGHIAAMVASGGAIVGIIAHLVAATAFMVRARAPRMSALSWPFGAFAVSRILMQAAATLQRREPIRWGGRDYILEPRD